VKTIGQVVLSWWNHLNHFLQAVLFGLLVACLPWFAYVVLLKAFPWLWEYWSVETDPRDRLALGLAFGQLFTSFVSLFLVGLFGWWAYVQFRETRERPDIYLETFGASVDGRFASFHLRLVNKGTAISRWYQLRAETPFLEWTKNSFGTLDSETLHPSANESARPVICEVGTSENWIWFHTGHGPESFFFDSRGNFALYPDIELPLALFSVPDDAFRKVGWTFHVHYKLLTDRGLHRSDVIEITFLPQDSSWTP
jgi:hypothetical protein